MNRKFKFILLILLIIIVITYVEWKISSGDPNFHFGKDGGLFRTLESIVALGAIFFVAMTNTKRIQFLFLGLFTSLISTIIVYLILGFCNIIDNLPFHIISCISFVGLFFYIEKRITNVTKVKINNNNQENRL